jgi:hypothetical protein
VLVTDNPTLALDAVGPSTPTIKNRGLCDPGASQDRAQTGTTIGECCHFRLGGVANASKVSADQSRNVGVTLRGGAEQLSSAIGGLDVTDADLNVAFAVFAAADEGRIQADADCCRRGRLIRHRIAQLLADPQRVAAQRLGALTGIDRQHVWQYLSGNPKGHQGGQSGLHLVQLRGRPAVRRPI